MQPTCIDPKSEKLPASCNGLKGTAFVVKDGACMYNFPRATFSAADGNKGFSLQWVSK